MPIYADGRAHKYQAPPQSQRIIINTPKTQKELLDKNFKGEKVADIIVPHHNRHDMLQPFLSNIDLSIFNIVICAGQSFGKNCNKGAKVAETDKLIFCNDDIQISNEQLIRIANCIGQYDLVGTTQIAGTGQKKKYWGIGMFENRDRTIRHQISVTEKDSVFPSGFCFGVKRKIWEEMNGFNERFRTGNEDVDFGLRALELKLKMTILDLEIRHLESQSSGRFNFVRENEDLFYSIWRQGTLKKIFNSNRKKR